MKLSLLAALSTNNVIGRNNDVPWHLSTDLKFLKSKIDFTAGLRRIDGSGRGSRPSCSRA